MKQLVLFICLIPSMIQLQACRCAELKKTFITSISDFTAQVEVVRIDTILMKENPYWSPILTKLKVVKTFSSNKEIEFVWMRNSSGTDCERGMFPDSIGQKYIITGRLYDIEYYKDRVSDAENIPFLHASTCRKSILHIEGEYVFGEITKNKRSEIQLKYQRLLLEEESKAKAYLEQVYTTKNHPDRVQEISLKEFYQLMKSSSLNN